MICESSPEFGICKCGYVIRVSLTLESCSPDRMAMELTEKMCGIGYPFIFVDNAVKKSSQLVAPLQPQKSKKIWMSVKISVEIALYLTMLTL